MPLFWLLLAGALFVLPLVLAYFAAPRGPDSFATALFRVPVALAADVMFVSLLTAFVPLAIATVASRAVYAVAFVIWRIRNRTHVDLHLPTLASASLAAVVAISASLELTWHFVIWDRGWHMPLVTALEGQKLPFANALDRSPLHYHLGGDLVAAMARALSFDHLSSASALSLVHDLFIGLSVGWLVALCRALGARGLGVPALVALGLAFHGALPRVVGTVSPGEPFFSFSQISYRPHAPVSLLAETMLIGGLVSRMVAPRIPGARRAIVSGLLVASLCDEASVGIYGLALGITWIGFPRILGRTRLRGAGVLCALLLAVIVPNLLITHTIGRGGAVHFARWVWPRFAGVESGSTPLFSRSGLVHGSMWLAAPLTALLALALSRRTSREALVFVCATFFIGLTLACCLVVNGSEAEAQRFYVAIFVAPLVVLALLARDVRPSLAPFAVVGVVTPAILTIYSDWAISRTLGTTENASGAHNDHKMPYSLFDVDCADVAPHRFGESPRRMYVDQSGHMLYSACRSLWVPGRMQADWGIETFEDTGSDKQKASLERNISGKTAPAACWNLHASDGVCADLKKRGLCKPGDGYFVDCTLPLRDELRTP